MESDGGKPNSATQSKNPSELAEVLTLLRKLEGRHNKLEEDSHNRIGCLERKLLLKKTKEDGKILDLRANLCFLLLFLYV